MHLPRVKLACNLFWIVTLVYCPLVRMVLITFDVSTWNISIMLPVLIHFFNLFYRRVAIIAKDDQFCGNLGVDRAIFFVNPILFFL